MLNFLKLIFGGMAARPLLTAGALGVGDYMATGGETLKSVMKNAAQPILEGASGLVKDGVNSLTESIKNGDITQWLKDNKEIALLGGGIGALFMSNGALRNWILGGIIAVGLFLGFKGQLPQVFNAVATPPAAAAPAATPVLQSALTFEKE